MRHEKKTGKKIKLKIVEGEKFRQRQNKKSDIPTKKRKFEARKGTRGREFLSQHDTGVQVHQHYCRFCRR